MIDLSGARQETYVKRCARRDAPPFRDVKRPAFPASEKKRCKNNDRVKRKKLSSVTKNSGRRAYKRAVAFCTAMRRPADRTNN